MLQDPVTIKSEHVLKKSQDYQTLFDEAIRLCQELSGNIWTDYNKHDPGVTLLTQLCYALSEVGYRTDIDMERLLYFAKNTTEERTEVNRHNAFFQPSEIYPTGAITQDDYRILIIDKIEGVADAWVQPVKNDRYGFKGLYQVVLKLRQEFDDEENRKVVIRKVEELLSANRNLCEDFEKIKVLVSEPISFKAKLEIKTESVEEEVLATIFQRIQDYFSPPTHYYEQETLEQTGLENHEVFQGPSFDMGFLQASKLTEYGRLFYISKMAELISTVPGVWNLSGFEVYIGGTQVFTDKFNLAEGHYPLLDVKSFRDGEPSFEMELTKGEISTAFNTTAVDYYLDSQKRRGDKSYDLSKKDRSKKLERTEESQLRHFESIQSTYPALYGVGDYGRRSVIMDLNTKKDAVTDGNVKQLQGFLYFFDQFLTNHLEQLASIRELFSIEPKEKLQSYYSTLLYGLDPDAEFSQGNKPGVLKEKANDLYGYYSLLKSDVRNEIERIREERDPVNDRLGRALTHLLARFGESFLADEYNNLDQFFNSPEQSINSKKQLLSQITTLGRKRACGFDYLKPSFESEEENLPIFKKKLGLLLNLPEAKDQSLICVTNVKGADVQISDVKAKETEKVGRKFEQAKASADLAHFPIIVKKNKKERIDIKNVDHLPYLFKYGTIRKNYDIIPNDNGVVLLYNPFEKKTGFKIFEAANEEEAEQRLKRIIDFLKDLEEEKSGFHVVEHILLRPLAVDQYRFVIRDLSGRELLESVDSDERELQIEKAEDAIETALSKANYEVVPRGGKFLVSLKRDGEEIARSIEAFVSQDQANDKIANLYLKELGKYKKGYDPLHTILTLLDDKNTIVPDPEKLNHRLSLVIPNWVSRYQNQDFIKFLKLALTENLPCWCQCDLRFVTNKQMIEFEGHWKNWLGNKVDRVPKLEVDATANTLVQFLNLLPSDE